jgi:hypothetical protein
MNLLHLPARVFESNLPKLLGLLARHDSTEGKVVLDFQSVAYWIPAAIVSTCASVDRWIKSGREVGFTNHNNSEACRYLQRIDFFETLGFALPEAFMRRDPGASFVEVQSVEPGVARLKDPLAGRLATCLAGSTDLQDDAVLFAEFSLGEVIANSQQHAGATGFVSGQYVQSRGWSRIGMADCGIGIRDSFRLAGSPHYREGMSHLDALQKALQPWVSSKNHLRTGPYGEPPNRGMGLSMIGHMLAATGGEFFVCSGDSWIHRRGSAPALTGTLRHELPGTVVSLLFDRAQINDFRTLVVEANRALDLTERQSTESLFE